MKNHKREFTLLLVTEAEATMYACQSQEWLFSAAAMLPAYLFQMHIDPRQTRHL